MNKFLQKIYDTITAPLYRRLSREVSIQTQSFHRHQLEYQERISKQMLDEIVRLNFIVQELSKDLPKTPGNMPLTLVPDYSFLGAPYIYTIIKQFEGGWGAAEIADKNKLPLATILDIKSRFSNMKEDEILTHLNTSNDLPKLSFSETK